MSKDLPDGVQVDIGRTGRVFEQSFEKDREPPIRSREERESRERDGWAYTKSRLQRHEKLTERQAEAACRRAREREHARKRDRGEDY